MLTITVPAIEVFDDSKDEFVIVEEERTLQLEHSLVSLSKWESRWCKPFLSSVDKTEEEVLDYIKCMTITQNVKPDVYNRLTQKNIEDINAYISAPMTATTFSKEQNNKFNREIVTAEIIYCWMTMLSIPAEYQKWHLNRLITLIRVCNIKNTPPKKRNRRDVASNYAKINAARRQQYNTKG